MTGEIGNYSRCHRVELKSHVTQYYGIVLTLHHVCLRNLYFLVFRFHFTENVRDPKCHEFKSRPEQNFQSAIAFGLMMHSVTSNFTLCQQKMIISALLNKEKCIGLNLDGELSMN